MEQAAQIKTASDTNGGIFYKCPLGGFASLRPGYCPKCRELLMLVSAAQTSAIVYEAPAPGRAMTSIVNRTLPVNE